MAQPQTHAHAVMEAIDLSYTYGLPVHPSFANNLMNGSIGCDKNPMMFEAPHRPVRLFRMDATKSEADVFEFPDGSQLFIGGELDAYAIGEVGSLDRIDKAEALVQESKNDLDAFNQAVTKRDHKACNEIKARYQMVGGSNSDTFAEIKWRINKREGDLHNEHTKKCDPPVEELAKIMFIQARRIRSDYADVQVKNNPKIRREITQKTLAQCKRIEPYATNSQWKDAAGYLNNQQRS